MIGGLTHFIFSKFLPTAAGELLLWLNEWQALVVGFAVLIAGSLWTRAMVRSSQRTAYLVSQSLRLMTEAFAENSRQTGQITVKSSNETENGPRELDARLDRMRAAIRGALSVIPQSGERVDSNVANLVRNIASYSFEDQRAKKGASEGQKRALADVEKCLAALKSTPVETMRCAEAWDSLVRLHRAARILRDGAFDEPQGRAA